eukprot:12123194-Alexandrium_andersonii.AAC.1
MSEGGWIANPICFAPCSIVGWGQQQQVPLQRAPRRAQAQPDSPPRPQARGRLLRNWAPGCNSSAALSRCECHGAA